MVFSQLLGLQERVEEIGEGGDGEDEAERGFEGHVGSVQIPSQRFTYQSDNARRPSVRSRKRASNMGRGCVRKAKEVRKEVQTTSKEKGPLD
jgi:hypothetical protein